MALTPVNIKPSSNLGDVQYDADSGELHVRFHRGDELTEPYVYKGVPQDQIDALVAADSSGSHFARNIKGVFEHVPPPKEDS